MPAGAAPSTAGLTGDLVDGPGRPQFRVAGLGDDGEHADRRHDTSDHHGAEQPLTLLP